MPDRPTDIEVSVIRTPEAMRDALGIRSRVFVEEQHVPIEEEVDAFDERPGERDDVVHVLVRLRGEPVATARLLLGHPADTSGSRNGASADAGEASEASEGRGYPHIGRVAVLAEHRGSGLGRVVMDALHQEARARGERGITLAAQLHAIPFYERLGYLAHGPVYLDAGIEHREMDYVFEE
jgi:predicted GNAT family N-acyltransferase